MRKQPASVAMREQQPSVAMRKQILKSRSKHLWTIMEGGAPKGNNSSEIYSDNGKIGKDAGRDAENCTDNAVHAQFSSQLKLVEGKQLERNSPLRTKDKNAMEIRLPRRSALSRVLSSELLQKTTRQLVL